MTARRLALALALFLFGCTAQQTVCHVGADVAFQGAVKACKERLTDEERTQCLALAEHAYDIADERCLELQ